MLSYEDCVGLCGLTEDEIAAIARHEHIPAIVAAELGNYLCHDAGGVPMVKAMILDDIGEAEAAGRLEEVVKLRAVLRHFVMTHPAAVAKKVD